MVAETAVNRTAIILGTIDRLVKDRSLVSSILNKDMNEATAIVITRAKLQKESGIAQDRLQWIMSGKLAPRSDELNRLAYALRALGHLPEGLEDSWPVIEIDASVHSSIRQTPTTNPTTDVANFWPTISNDVANDQQSKAYICSKEETDAHLAELQRQNAWMNTSYGVVNRPGVGQHTQPKAERVIEFNKPMIEDRLVQQRWYELMKGDIGTDQFYRAAAPRIGLKTANALANAANVDFYKAHQLWEGPVRLEPEVAEKLAELFGVDVEELLRAHNPT